MGYKDPEKQREYQRQWIARRKAEWFEGKSCVECGSTENLELDHIDPATKITNAIWSWSEERRNAELAKCQVLCHDCHVKKTHIDLDHFQHGTPSEYQRGCRCVPCRANKSAAMKRETRRK